MKVRHASVAEPEARRDNGEYGGDFQNRKRNLYASAEPYAEIIDDGEKDNRAGRCRLRPREHKIVRRAAKRKREMPRKDGNRERGDQKTRKSRQACGYGRCRTRLAYSGMHPAKKKTPDGAQTSTQVCVLSAGFGHRRGELGQKQ